MEQGRESVTVRSIMETLETGTRTDMPRNEQYAHERSEHVGQVSGREQEGLTVEFSLELGEDQLDGTGSTRTRGNDIIRNGAAYADISLLLTFEQITNSPKRRFFLLNPSNKCCEAVDACTVVNMPASIPHTASNTFAIGAKQFVVQLALETTSISLE